MNELNGKRIALLEARLGGELARLIERNGGIPSQFPALREQAVDASAEVAALITQLAGGQIPFIVFQTGVGVTGLLNEAEKLGLLEELREALRNVTTICRGPKPTAVLTRAGIKPAVQTREPYTTAELLEAMSTLELDGQGVALLHYGERNDALAGALKGRGARLHELCLYEWRLPEDITPLLTLIGEAIRGAFDAVIFTSQIQARHLFQIAAERTEAEALRDALNQRTVVASIGPTCSAALRALGVEPRVEPENPKMGPMALALGQYFTDPNRSNQEKDPNRK
jgi:uroporphyrinogen-III synthase